jgi:inhibitor of KinA
MDKITIFHIGDQAITLSFPPRINEEDHHRIMAIRDWLLVNTFDGMLDVIVAFNSISLVYDAPVVKKKYNESPFEYVVEKLSQAYHHTGNTFTRKDAKFLRVPVCYDAVFAIDLDFVSAHTKLDIEMIIRIHTEKIYTVWMIGFLPGFPYMGTVDPRIAVPRKQTPQSKVEAGSVGLAGMQTGIYPMNSPGGWQIVGRTPLQLFEKNNESPVLFEPGDTVQFYSISKQEFDNFFPSKI